MSRTELYVNKAPGLQCLYCPSPLTGHVGQPDGGPVRPPEPGDFTICLGCGGVLVYHRGPLNVGPWAFRPPTADETEANAAMFARLRADMPATRALVDAAGLRRPTPRE